MSQVSAESHSGRQVLAHEVCYNEAIPDNNHSGRKRSHSGCGMTEAAAGRGIRTLQTPPRTMEPVDTGEYQYHLASRVHPACHIQSCSKACLMFGCTDACKLADGCRTKKWLARQRTVHLPGLSKAGLTDRLGCALLLVTLAMTAHCLSCGSNCSLTDLSRCERSGRCIGMRAGAGA